MGIENHILTRLEPVLKQGLVINVGVDNLIEAGTGESTAMLLDPKFAPDMQPVELVIVGKGENARRERRFPVAPAGKSIVHAVRASSTAEALVSLLAKIEGVEPDDKESLLPLQIKPVLNGLERETHRGSVRFAWDKYEGITVAKISGGSSIFNVRRERFADKTLVQAVGSALNIFVPQQCIPEPAFVPRVPLVKRELPSPQPAEQPRMEIPRSQYTDGRHARGVDFLKLLLSKHPELGSTRREVFDNALKQAHGSITGTARVLGTSYSYARNNLIDLNLITPETREKLAS